MKREILLVDDERTLITSMKRVLTEAGYGVRTASNGEAAVAAVRESAPDLVLLDVMMPGMSGLETCRELRASDPKLPIVFLTALDTPEDELKGLASGGNSYIAKTVPDEVLLARLAALFRLREENVSSGGDFDFGIWRVEAEKLRMVRESGRTQPLTEREIAFMRLLASRPGTVFDRDAVLTQLWGVDSDISDNALSTLVYNLRKKLGSSAKALASARGVGYAYRP